MTRRVKRAMTAVALALAVAGGSHVFAQERGGPGHRGFGGPRFERMSPFGLFRGLDLTDEQRTQVKAIFEQHRDELRKVGERVDAAFRTQQDAVTAVPVDESAIRARTTELAAAQAEAAVLRARIHSEVYQILTPEQQQKAQELRADREQRRQQMRQRMQERRQQPQQQQQQQPPQQ